MHTKLRRTALVSSIYFGAYTISALIFWLRENQGQWGSANTASHSIFLDALQFLAGHLLLSVVYFPLGFGFQSLEWSLLFVPHLIYLTLAMTIIVAKSEETYRYAWITLITLLSLNFVGCTFTPHEYSFH